MTSRCMWLISATLVLVHPAAASAQTVQELQRQIDELKAQLQALTEAQVPRPLAAAPAAIPPAADVGTPNAPQVAAAPKAVMPVASSSASEASWYDRPRFRGYTQMRYNAVVAGDETAPDGVSRLRSVHDASINENGGFLLRRVRLVLQGNVTDHIQLYLQHDFGTAVNNQSSTERRENFGQLRDAYVDIFSPGREFRLRVGQSKVPVG